ncbi:hypothetical protein R3P38DRAFT_2811682 [Favolaschia claudopus]|uniref:Uncharacterized protein n=1 Tax=Favolaschia claudopus TaxID=2862362 RepID=A0AAV9Z9F7_9AGAR
MLHKHVVNEPGGVTAHSQEHNAPARCNDGYTKGNGLAPASRLQSGNSRCKTREFPGFTGTKSSQALTLEPMLSTAAIRARIGRGTRRVVPKSRSCRRGSVSIEGQLSEDGETKQTRGMSRCDRDFLTLFPRLFHETFFWGERGSPQTPLL